jgi:hypothetical protein
VLARIASVARHTEVGVSVARRQVAELRALTVRAMEIEIDTPRTFGKASTSSASGAARSTPIPTGSSSTGPMFEAMRLFGLFTREAAWTPTAPRSGRDAPPTTAPIATADGPHLDRDLRQHPRHQIAAGRDWLRLNLAAWRKGWGSTR